MDDELSTRARQLVDAALEADVPPPSVADGSWEIVVSRLTIEAERVDVVPEAPRVRARGPVLLVIGLIVATTALLGWLLSRPRPVIDAKPPPAPQPTAKPTHAEHIDTPHGGLPSPVEPVSDALLDEAETATPAEALELLERHAELSPLGPDSERRMALRVTTLCALGRVDDAKADAIAFLSRPRDAKWTAKVRESCGAP